ncbi:MAG: hypothetical protein LKI47_06565 [Clostridium sp.]|uniref:hypothetical protein n=1 Tax=Clostridium sp. TaxID=1506 RepID=UPI0025BB2DF7|nr:hypothetical protein [Clostridium sp.]MCI1715496.1 hypothetical protein [Clostridium sp.]MCI2200630.1 hypothetical protein [Clostridium sp.]
MKSGDNIQNAEYINKISAVQEYIEKAWESFVLCEFDNGMKYFGEIMIGLDRIITYIADINGRLEANISISHMLEILQELEKCIIIKDYVYSADLLKYEIDPILGKWKELLA